MHAMEDTEVKRKVAIYIRVSTQEQKIDGYSLEAQHKKLTSYVNDNPGLHLETKEAWIYTDTHPGSDMNRTELQRLLGDVKAGKYDAVLVWKIDRLSRSLQHLLSTFEMLQKHDVSFISVQENIDFTGPIGSLIFQIFGAIAQFERELIKGRTQMGKIASAEMGNFTGTSVPYGYKEVKNKGGKGKKLALIPEEQKWVERIYEWYIYEGLGHGQIARRLNELSVPKMNHRRTKRASIKWTPHMVKTIVQSSIYRGEFVANRKDEAGALLPEDQWTVVKVPACVSEFTFQQAQETAKRRVGGSTGTPYLLSGKLVDMDLETPKKFTGAPRYKGGFSYRRKQFEKDDETHVPVFEIPGKQMEEYVWGKVLEAMREPEIFIEHYLSKQYADPGKVEKLEKQLEHLRKRRADEGLAIEKIEHAYETGTYSEEKLSKKLAEKEGEIGRLEGQIQDIEDELGFATSVDVEVQKLKDASKQVKYRLDNLDNKQKKILCDLFVDRIEMRRKKVGGRWKINADIFFRFNPKKFENEIRKGRTQKALEKATKGILKKEKEKIGGRWKT